MIMTCFERYAELLDPLFSHLLSIFYLAVWTISELPNRAVVDTSGGAHEATFETIN